MLGRPAITDPVCAKIFAGAWLKFSVRMVLTMAMSSAITAVFGSSSEIQAPLWPCRENFQGEPSIFWCAMRSMNAKRLPFISDSGGACPLNLSSTGLCTNMSSWLGPPAMKR